MRRRAAALMTLALAVACGGSGDKNEAKADLFSALPKGEPIVSTSNLGPVRAEVRVRPATPRLGDTVYLELKVTAPAAIDIVMPPFGDALGRFSIVDYDFRDSRAGDVTTREQLYQLQAAASGKVRLPQLRVEVVDRRANAENAGEEQELLTDEILLDVAAIEIPPGESQMKPNLGTIEIKPLRPWHFWWFWLAIAGVLVAIAVVVAVRLLKKAAVAARQNAYERAMARLAVLLGAGLPEADEIDAWYVELSSVVRHYLEGRFSVRAPELTTEEFLREAQRAADLSADHRQTLADFLAGCDRVKFAGVRPSAQEQTEALRAAQRFVEDTRPREVAA